MCRSYYQHILSVIYSADSYPSLSKIPLKYTLSPNEDIILRPNVTELVIQIDIFTRHIVYTKLQYSDNSFC